MVRGAHPRDENGNYTCPGRVPVETLIAEWENREYKVHPNEQETFDKVKRIEEQKKRYESMVKPLEAIGNEKAILKSPLLTQDKSLLNDIALGRGRAILKGDSSFEIIKIQEALNNFGFDIRPSGVFCDETEGLFNEFRKNHIPTNSVHSSYVSVDNCIIDSNAILRIDEALIESWKAPVLKSDLFKNSEGLNELAKNKTPAIKLKSKNKDDIAIIQETLIQFGFELGKSGADGFFGEKTELAVMSFQANFNPTHEVHENYQKHLADGVVNADAILAMDEASVIDWKYVNNNYGISIDHVFISQLEGVELNGYVPMPESSNSGVTIAVGFDLGARNEADLIALQFPSSLIDIPVQLEDAGFKI